MNVKFLAWTTAALLLLHGAAYGQENSEASAEKHFNSGVKLFNKKKYEKALAEFDLSFKTYPHWKIRFNIGLCHFELDHYVEAAEQFSAFLREGGKEISQTQKKHAENRMDELKQKLGILRISGKSGKWTVTVDGDPREDLDEGQDIYLLPGKHAVTVAVEGKTLLDETVSMAAGKTEELTVSGGAGSGGKEAGEPESTAKIKEGIIAMEMESGAGKDKETVEEAAPEQKKKRPGTWKAAWGTLAAGVGCLIAGTTLGVFQLKEKGLMEDAEDDYVDMHGTPGVTAEQLEAIEKKRDSHFYKARDYFIATTALLGAGAALTASSIALFAVSAKKRSERPAGRLPGVLAGPGFFHLKINF
jgi:hypothetical protein